MVRQRNYEYLIKTLTKDKIKRLLHESAWSRAMLARLRRGIGKQPGELPELFEVFLGNMPEEFYGKNDKPSEPEWAIYTALTLFALHQQGKDCPMSVRGDNDRDSGISLGAAVGYLVKRDKNRETSIKRRFDATITANVFTELAHHARGLIQLLRAGDIALDYPRFAEDLYRYQFDEMRNRVRLRWGEDYYRITQSNAEKENGGIQNEQL